MGCSQSKAPATPGQKCATGGAAAGTAAGDVASSGRAFVSSWVTHASYELPPEDRRAGPPRSALIHHRRTSAAFSPSNNNTGANHLPFSSYPGDDIRSYSGGGDGGSRTRRHASHPNDDYLHGDEDDDGEAEAGNALVQDEMMEEEEEEGTSARVRAWGGGPTTAAQQRRVAVRPTPSSGFGAGSFYYDAAGGKKSTPPVALNDAAARSAKRAPSHAAASSPPPRSSLVSSSSAAAAAAVCENAECDAATNASDYHHQADYRQHQHSTPLNFPPPPNIFTECGTVHGCLLDENNSINNNSVKDETCWQGRSVVWQCPAPLNAPPRSRVCSPWFTGLGASSTTCASSSSPPPFSVGAVVQRPVLQWRLFWEVQDFGRVRSESRNLE